MAEVLPPPLPSPSPSPADSSDSLPTLPQPRAQPRERVPSYAQNRISQYSRSSQRSRPQSTATDFPAFASSLPYALVRDFAYPAFHPLHYGADPDDSGASTPASEWTSTRRQSDPMEQWNSSAGAGGWSAGPWGGDGVMYGDPDPDADLAALPSTSFGHEDGGAGADGDDELVMQKGKHRKSKSYANMSDYERGRRRESGRRSRDAEAHMFHFHGSSQRTDPAGRDSLRQSRGYSNSPLENGASRHKSTLPHRSFHQAQSQPTTQPSTTTTTTSNTSTSPSHNSDEDEEQIPLDTEPAPPHSPLRSSMGPEDEELFAGLSLALYSFEPENSNELRLSEGQEIMVSYRHGQGWLVASDPRTGEQGLVPEAYVRLIADMPNYDVETGMFLEDEEGEEGETGRDGEDAEGEREGEGAGDIEGEGHGSREDSRMREEDVGGRKREGGDGEGGEAEGGGEGGGGVVSEGEM